MTMIPSTPEATLMSRDDFAMDALLLEYVTQACSEVLGDRKAAERVALKVSVSPRVEYAALCYMSESEPWETLIAAVRDALPVSEPVQAPEAAVPALPAGTRVRCIRTGETGVTATGYDPADPFLSPSSDPRSVTVSFVADSPLRGYSKQRDELVSDLVAL